jgi:hypothetical protein
LSDDDWVVVSPEDRASTDVARLRAAHADALARLAENERMVAAAAEREAGVTRELATARATVRQLRALTMRQLRRISQLELAVASAPTALCGRAARRANVRAQRKALRAVTTRKARPVNGATHGRNKGAAFRRQFRSKHRRSAPGVGRGQQRGFVKR